MLTVILAGGKGRRILEETKNKPKALVKIGDKPILRHIIDFYLAQGHNKFLVLAGYKGDCIVNYFENLPEFKKKYCYENYIIYEYKSMQVEILYTGEDTNSAQRLKIAKPYIKEERFMLTYCDGLSSVNVNELINTHIQKKFVITISAVRPKPRYGILDIDDNGYVIELREKSIDDSPLINGGFMVFERTALEYIGEDMLELERDLLSHMAIKRNLGVYIHKGFWQCMDTVFERDCLEELYKKNNYPWQVERRNK